MKSHMILGVAMQRAGLIQQGWIGARFGRGGLQGGDGVDQGILGGDLCGMDGILDGIDARQHRVHIRVALPAGLLGVQQRAHDVVAGIFHGPVPEVRHVAVRAGLHRR